MSPFTVNTAVNTADSDDATQRDTFNIPNYSFLCKSRSSRRGGGVGIYVNKTYNYKERTDLSIFL